ncbi:P-loop containing nucleoside triphosphate hydrolase protein [Schizopora paradoxa]|uniref:p-loop containing nucleoside triphosphate hydrolase protein n=1 Tax=Schizopora paradoxa TaxID=27342 RepID=A0A0H2RNI8_9AGAM|nr:P-loop containing nucleoside triphosphate hydrolase protein [Schizopora paradoxa]
MPSTSRRMTRSQTATATVLGKRSGGALSRSPSVASLRSSSSSALLTPDTTPDAKKPRTSAGEVDEDPMANKENIPPLKDVVMATPVSRRLTRRATTTGDFVTPTSTRTARTPRRNASLISAIPQTPSTSLSQLTLQTPPPTPPISLPLHARARACLRSTSNASHIIMSSEGREKETELIRGFLVQDVDEEEDGDVKPILYISGSPGTGKTALVNTILSSLETSPGHNLKTIFLNCMTFQNVDAVWNRLQEELLGSTQRGKRASSSKQKSSRESVVDFFEKNRSFKCAFILDEMDHLTGISPIALRPLFNLATRFPSSVRIMGIANTHTLTSSSSSLPFDDISSLNIETVHFKPYKPSELQAILMKRLESLPQDDLKKMLPPPVLMLLTKKVASQTGDVRVLFEVLRGAIELAAPSSASASPSSESPIASVVVTPKHITDALKSYTPSATTSRTTNGSSGSVVTTNSEIIAKIYGLSLQQRLALLVLLLATKRLTSGLPLASSASSTPAASPTKRSPVKRTQSSASASFSSSCTDVVGDASSGVDINILFSFYSHLLQTADTFSVVSRSEFADLLAVLETTGLLNIQSTSSGRSSFKRSASFTGRAGMGGAGGAATSQSARLHSDVREAEVARGMGLDLDGASASSSSGSGGEGIANVMLEEVRAIWKRELTRIRKEKEALARKAMAEGVDLFEDAMEA